MPRTSPHRPDRRRLVAATLLAVSLLLSACDIGWEGPSYEGASGSPSGSKPQSKVWFNDGSWWADLWDAETDDFYIHRLDLGTRTWTRTGARLDDRANSRSDVLWDGTHLYVASHAFAEGASTTPTGHPARLRRFSYDPATRTYSLDPGFPVQINDARTETLVIDRDSTGRLWATWVQNRKVMVAVSEPGGTSWGNAFELPGAGQVTSDDISTVVAFGSGKIGVMWSDQDADTVYFAPHTDGVSPTTWGPTEVAYTGRNAADDHINIKSVADQSGRIVVAVKTSMSGSDPMVVLLDRSAGGLWGNRPFGVGTDNHTRPIVVVNGETQRAHVFAASPQSGGQIYEKTAPLSDLSFAPGKGRVVLRDDDSDDINNPTSTKQTVSSATGLVVLATNDDTRRYWTYYDPLNGSPPPPTTTTSTTQPTTTEPTTTTSEPATTTTVPSGDGVTFDAVADAQVKSTSPATNYGTLTTVRLRGGDDGIHYRSHLRFSVTGLAAPPSGARLRLWVTDASRSGGAVATTTDGWAEETLTWATAPPATGPVLDSLDRVEAGTWAELDVSGAVTGNGVVQLVLSTTDTDSVIYGSRESTHPPQLVVTP